jgi:hypothetical protein
LPPPLLVLAALEMPVLGWDVVLGRVAAGVDGEALSRLAQKSAI